MKVCYFGIYSPDYPRNRVFMKGLRQNGVGVAECNARGWGWFKYVKLVFKHWLIRNDYDAMVVGFPGQGVMRLARRLTKKPIIFDTFLSLYDSVVWDRKLIAADSAAAARLFIQDKTACQLANLVLVDTQAHLRYFVSSFDLPPGKFRKIFVGTDEDIFSPRPKISPEFVVHVHGKYIPLQGIEYIVEAATILRHLPLRFRILGRGQEYDKIASSIREQNLRNIELVDMVPYEKLAAYIGDADVCLGIFGNSEKTQRVIPNKVVEYLACGKPVITADSPAIRELLTDMINARFCRAADSADLADKILELYENPDLRKTLGQNARQVYLEKLTTRILGGELKKIINEVV